MSDRDGCGFDPARCLALRAATAETEGALGAWRELVDRFDLADLWDDEVYRLLPLVWHRLGDEVGVEHAGRLKGLYRKAWVTNRHLLRRAGEVVTAMQDEAIGSLVLRGLPLGLQFYEDLATRPIGNVDLLVRPDDAEDAWRLLEGLGYRARPVPGRTPTSPRRDRRHDGLRPGRPRVFDCGTLDVVEVHTTLAPELVAADPTMADVSAQWDRAVGLDLDGVAASTLSPTDHLFHTLVRGWGGERVSTSRVVDALAILDRTGDRIDWPLLAAAAQRHRCSLIVGEGLHDLRGRWGASVPVDLGLPPPDRRQRTAQWLRRRAGPVGGHTAARLVTSTRGLGPLATVGRAPQHLADRWHLDHRRQLPSAVVRRLRHGLRRPR